VGTLSTSVGQCFVII